MLVMMHSVSSLASITLDVCMIVHLEIFYSETLRSVMGTVLGSVGSETSGGMRNITFQNINMKGTSRGPRIRVNVDVVEQLSRLCFVIL